MTWRIRLFEHALPIIVLVIIGSFTYAVFFQIPYAGFEFSNGRVSQIITRAPESGFLQVGDRLIKVEDVNFDEFHNNLRARLIENVSVGQALPLVVERNEQTISIDWIFPGPSQEQVFERINSQWWFAYVFWFAGTAMLLLIRPRGIHWALFVSLCYLTAIWLGAGSGPSHWHLGQSAIVLRAAIWLSVPVYLHFHWIFPRALGKLPAVLWGGLYLGAVVFAVLEWFQVLTISSFYAGGLIALGGSILLLVSHYLLQRKERDDIRLLLLSSFLTLLPIIAINVSHLLEIKPSAFAEGGAFLAFPAIPGAYFYAMFRKQYEELVPRANRMVRIYLAVILLGVLFIVVIPFLDAQFHLENSTLALGLVSIAWAGFIAGLTFFPFLTLPALAESSIPYSRKDQFNLRANRLVSIYLFFTLVVTAFAGLLFVIDNTVDFRGKATVLGVLAGLSIGIFSVYGFNPFQRFIEHTLLGIPLPPNELLETYSSKITTSLDSQLLVQLLRDQVLPTLLVRQSALLEVSENNSIELLYAAGIHQEQIPTSESFRSMREQFVRSRDPLISSDWPAGYAWVRIIFPLKVEGRIIGLWLLGSRDPDDSYAPTEITVLETIANQTAIALVNIDQADKLHALLQADIERQDTERTSLARGLHDVVLNQLASISMYSESRGGDQALKADLQTAIDFLREMVSNLRPAMLAFGLYHGLAELVDRLNDRDTHGMVVRLEISPTDIRYDEKIEQNIFWIVHQACENATSHSRGTTLTIQGILESGSIQLSVEDDGSGFSYESELNIPEMLSARHYGLVGMYERADLIGAQLQFDSSPGRGTKVSVELSSRDLIA